MDVLARNCKALNKILYPDISIYASSERLKTVNFFAEARPACAGFLPSRDAIAGGEGLCKTAYHGHFARPTPISEWQLDLAAHGSGRAALRRGVP